MTFILRGLAATLILSSFGMATAEAATELKTAAELQSALTAGETVNVVIDLPRCMSNATPSAPGTMRGGLRISAFLIRPDNSISFSDDHFTMTTKDAKPIYQFLRYQVRPDNSASFSMTVMSMPDMKPTGQSVQYECKVGDGLSFFKQE